MKILNRDFITIKDAVIDKSGEGQWGAWNRYRVTVNDFKKGIYWNTFDDNITTAVGKRIVVEYEASEHNGSEYRTIKKWDFDNKPKDGEFRAEKFDIEPSDTEKEILENTRKILKLLQDKFGKVESGEIDAMSMPF